MAEIKDGFFKRAAEWLVLAGILTGWGITLGSWSSRLNNVEVAVVKTTAEVEVLKTNQIKVLTILPYVNEALDSIQKTIVDMETKNDIAHKQILDTMKAKP